MSSNDESRVDIHENGNAETSPQEYGNEIERRNRRFKLYRAASRGDWNTVKRIINIRVKLSKDGGTVLHIAAARGHTGFVKKLLEKMNKQDLAVPNDVGNTAFFLAAASKRVEIVKAMMEKNDYNQDIIETRGDNGMLPLHKAALIGDKETVEYLYKVTKDETLNRDKDHINLLISLINRGWYDIALDLVKRHPNPNLATARDKNDETALHSLARMPILTRVVDLTALEVLMGTIFTHLNIKDLGKDTVEHRRQWLGRSNLFISRIPVTTEEIPQSASELIKSLWEQIMLLDDSGISEIIRKPWPLLFEATKQGNLAFLNIIFGAYPDLMFEVDENNKYGIFYWAVLHHQRKIFKTISENASFRDLVVQNTEEKNKILLLAAQLPPSVRPKTESGAALQLREELLFFKEVEKILQPLDIEATNRAEAIFTVQHKELKDKAERWMKDTANSCLVAATIVASVVFAAFFTVPGGFKEETGTPHFVRKASFIIFAISDAIALMFSSFSILSFLSVISSPYAEEDFISQLPGSLSSGLVALSSSISLMMLAFCATIFIVFKDGMLWIPILVTVIAFFISSTFQDVILKIIVDVLGFVRFNSIHSLCSLVKRVFYKEGMQ